MSAAAGPAPAPAAAVGPDLSKFKVYFTGIFTKGDDKDSIFEGTLAEPPGRAMRKDSAPVFKSDLPAEEFKERINTLVRSGVCAENVNPDYIFEAGADGSSVYDKNPIRMLIWGPPPAEAGIKGRLRGVDMLPLAFLIGHFTNEGRGAGLRHGAYIEVICSFKSAGIGTAFLQYFHRLIALLDLDFVKLSALASVVTYYPNPKIGYRFRTDCSPATPGYGPEILTEYDLISEKRPKDKVTGKAIWPTTTEEALEDGKYLTFLHHLHTQGLTTKKEGDCADTRMRKHLFRTSGCANDGFHMALCDLTRFKAEIAEEKAAHAAATGAKAGGKRHRTRRTHRRRLTRKHK